MGGAIESAVGTFLQVSTECVLAVRGGVLVQLWQDQPTVEGVKLVHLAAQESSEPFQVVVVIVDDSAATPRPEARAALNELSKSLAPAPTAVVYQGSGFGAAAVRGVAMAVSAASGGAAVIKAVSSFEQASQWLETQSKAPGLESLELFVAEMRRRGAAPPKK
jgi:hypothetical protein